VLTLPSILQNTIRLYGRSPAISEEAGNLTWAEYGAAIQRAAGMLERLGVGRGERFAIIARNCHHLGELIYAGYWSGRIPVPINYRLAPAEVAAILADSECRYLAIDPAFAKLLDAPELAGWRERSFQLGPDGADTGLRKYPELRDAAEPMAPIHAEEHDDALMLYTGGTTGAGKGVRISNRNIVSNALQIMQVMRPHLDDVYLHSTPMFHAAEVKSTIFTMFGSSHCYLPEFTPKAFLAAIERHKATVAGLVPTTLLRVLEEPGFNDYDLSSLRLISYGTSPILPAVVRRAAEAFPGTGFQQCYGLTECSPYLAMLDEEAHVRGLNGEEHLLTSAGRPVPGVDLRILDDDGNELPTGQVGEVVVRGPQISQGYHNRPVENEAAFRDDGFHTGDVGKLDDEGFLYILDRKRDMIITGGENVYTREVEEVLGRHTGVKEVSVIGVPHRDYGEALFAVIVPSDGWTPSADELIEHCRPLLGGYKIPRQMAFVDELPKSTMGKVLKGDLRDLYATETEEREKAS
jgi:long-chain acyl-CoA synthetase